MPKAAEIVKNELKYAHSQFDKIAILKRVLDLLKEAHELDPGNEYVRRDHNEILRVHRTASPW